MPPSAPPIPEAAPPAPPRGPGEPEHGGVPAWLAHPALWHVAYWMMALSVEVLPVLAGGRGRFTAAWLTDLSKLYLLIAVPGYVHLWVLVPRLARRGQVARYLLAAAAVTLTGAAVLLVDTSAWPLQWGAPLAIHYLRWVLSVLAFAIPVAAFDLAAVQLRAQRERAERERAHAVRRLEQLRSQLNPHFLFNTLNSLYALSIDRSPELPELILKHASLLRYALYGAERERVALEREVEFLAGYVELERLRVDERTEVRFEVRGVVADQQIAPLLLVPLVENCFKHLGARPGSDPFVHVELDVGPDTLHLSLRNSTDPGALHARDAAARGIGLANTRERLALLYPHRHTLAVLPGAGEFAVELRVELRP